MKKTTKNFRPMGDLVKPENIENYIEILTDG